MQSAELRGAAAAIAFQTRIPLARWFALDEHDVRRSVLAFPVVGASVGALLGATAYGLARFLPPAVAAPLAVAVAVLVTGAIHLDALADAADALGARSREQALEIMRDHHIGAFGAAALALDVLVKSAAVAALARGVEVVTAAAAAGALARVAAVVLAAALPYARAEGVAAPFVTASRLRCAAASVVGIAVALVLVRATGAAIVVAGLVITVVLAWTARRALGGVTGDVLGAAVEITETLALVVAVALYA